MAWNRDIFTLLTKSLFFKPSLFATSIFGPERDTWEKENTVMVNGLICFHVCMYVCALSTYLSMSEVR
jgi:hypothetical protein